jgi:hypothetical protein
MELGYDSMHSVEAQYIGLKEIRHEMLNSTEDTRVCFTLK